MDTSTVIWTGLVVTVGGGLILWGVIELFKLPGKRKRQAEAAAAVKPTPQRDVLVELGAVAEHNDSRTQDEMHDDISVRTHEVQRKAALREAPWKVTYFMGNNLEIQNRGPETAERVEFIGSESCTVVAVSLPGGEIDAGEIVQLRLAQTFGPNRWADVKWRWRSDPQITFREQRLDLGSVGGQGEGDITDPTPPQARSITDLLETLVNGPGGEPWTLEHDRGDLWVLRNRTPSTARRVTIQIHKTVYTGGSTIAPTWAEIPGGNSVTFKCRPGWGSSRDVEVGWDAPEMATGRGVWRTVLPVTY